RGDCAARRGSRSCRLRAPRTCPLAPGVCTAASRTSDTGPAVDRQRQDRSTRPARDAPVIPYADPSYFLLIVYPLLGLIGLGLAGRLGRRVVLVTSLALVAFQYGDPLGNVAAGFRTLGVLVLHVCGSIAVVRTYAAIRARRPPG